MSYVYTTVTATYGYETPPDLAYEDTGNAWVIKDQDGLTLAITRDEGVAKLLCQALRQHRGQQARQEEEERMSDDYQARGAAFTEALSALVQQHRVLPSLDLTAEEVPHLVLLDLKDTTATPGDFLGYSLHPNQDDGEIALQSEWDTTPT